MDSPQQNTISEPELITGFPEPPAPDAAGAVGPSAQGRSRFKAWAWGGLAGAVAASVVWGGGLYAVGAAGHRTRWSDIA
ncbi:hypothetical protein AB0G67_47375 [Streptomyces sp. NPDC021056]|uniref:hypothetical protein n=1 Tax=Streptomyces sp. NPDC021056 TaxID=3155012 RepID=UPI0033FB6781